MGFYGFGQQLGRPLRDGGDVSAAERASAADRESSCCKAGRKEVGVRPSFLMFVSLLEAKPGHLCSYYSSKPNGNSFDCFLPPTVLKAAACGCFCLSFAWV